MIVIAVPHPFANDVSRLAARSWGRGRMATAVELVVAGVTTASDVPMPENLFDELTAGTKLLWLVVTSKGEILAAMLTALYPMRSSNVQDDGVRRRPDGGMATFPRENRVLC